MNVKELSTQSLYSVRRAASDNLSWANYYGNQHEKNLYVKQIEDTTAELYARGELV